MISRRNESLKFLGNNIIIIKPYHFGAHGFCYNILCQNCSVSFKNIGIRVCYKIPKNFIYHVNNIINVS